MKIIVPEGQSSVGGFGGGITNLGPNNGQSVLFVYDVWYGAEWAFAHAQIPTHKEAPVSMRWAGNLSIGTRTNFRLAAQFPENQPPGGPFVLFIVPHSETGPKMLGPGTTEGGARFPAGAPASQQRWYNNEGIQPMAAEFGVAPERWTRVWHYFERRPERDWINTVQSDLLGKRMTAYGWHLWAADTERDPVQILNGDLVTIGHAAETPEGLARGRFTMSAGNAGRDTQNLVGRGDLVAYQRNWIALHGTSRREVLELLRKPVGN